MSEARSRASLHRPHRVESRARSGGLGERAKHLTRGQPGDARGLGPRALSPSTRSEVASTGRSPVEH